MALAALGQPLPSKQDACTLTPARIGAGRVVRPRRAQRDGHAVGRTLTGRCCSSAEPPAQGEVGRRLVPPVVVCRTGMSVLMGGDVVDPGSRDVRRHVDSPVAEIGGPPASVTAGYLPGGNTVLIARDPGDGLVEQEPGRWPVSDRWCWGLGFWELRGGGSGSRRCKVPGGRRHSSACPGRCSSRVDRQQPQVQIMAWWLSLG